MINFNEYEQIEILLIEGKISSYNNVRSGKSQSSFGKTLNAKGVAKLYVLKEDAIVYVGTTMQSLSMRIRQGLTVDGKNGYHGYKWKHREKLQLYVWSFTEFDKSQIEAIEAELVYHVRATSGKWPLFQNEIHFNNDFEFARIYAEEIYKRLKQDFGFPQPNPVKEAFARLPLQWGLRGDAFLWKALKASLEMDVAPKSSSEFEALLHKHYKRITGKEMNKEEDHYVKQFDLGGMSSGMVNGEFWCEKGFPLLVSNFNKVLQEA